MVHVTISCFFFPFTLWKFLCSHYLQWSVKWLQCFSAFLNNILLGMKSDLPINNKGSWKIRIKKWVCLKYLLGFCLSSWSASQHKTEPGSHPSPNYNGSLVLWESTSGFQFCEPWLHNIRTQAQGVRVSKTVFREWAEATWGLCFQPFQGPHTANLLQWIG